MSEVLDASRELFYDPFAEAGQENYNPLVAHAAMWEHYKNRQVEHDYTADKFLADTQALMMDSQFLDRFAEAEMIAARMHILCGENHELNERLQANESMSEYLDLFGNSHDGHNHDETDHEHDKDKHKKSNKDKKPNGRLRGWLDAYIRKG